MLRYTLKEFIELFSESAHPVTGEQHIVARDHGYNEEVMKAYKEARQKAQSKFRRMW